MVILMGQSSSSASSSLFFLPFRSSFSSFHYSSSLHSSCTFVPIWMKTSLVMSMNRNSSSASSLCSLPFLSCFFLFFSSSSFHPCASFIRVEPKENDGHDNIDEPELFRGASFDGADREADREGGGDDDHADDDEANDLMAVSTIYHYPISSKNKQRDDDGDRQSDDVKKKKEEVEEEHDLSMPSSPSSHIHSSSKLPRDEQQQTQDTQQEERPNDGEEGVEENEVDAPKSLVDDLPPRSLSAKALSSNQSFSSSSSSSPSSSVRSHSALSSHSPPPSTCIRDSPVGAPSSSFAAFHSSPSSSPSFSPDSSSPLVHVVLPSRRPASNLSIRALAPTDSMMDRLRAARFAFLLHFSSLLIILVGSYLFAFLLVGFVLLRFLLIHVRSFSLGSSPSFLTLVCTFVVP